MHAICFSNTIIHRSLTGQRQVSKSDGILSVTFRSEQHDQGLRSEPDSLHNAGQKTHSSETPKTGSVKKHTVMKYQCEYCPKPFNFRRDLERHMSIHTGIYKFSCLVCGKGFNRNDHLTKHYNSHLKNTWQYKFHWSLNDPKKR